MLDNEKDIIARAARGETAAFGALYDHYHTPIYRFVFLKVSEHATAEDITHQVFLSAWQNMPRYVDKGHQFGSWLYEIARNGIIDHYRTQRDHMSIELSDPELFVSPAMASLNMDNVLEMETVRAAIRKLRPEYQDVLILRYVEEKSLLESAELMQKSVGAVKLMQHRAMRALKKTLGL